MGLAEHRLHQLPRKANDKLGLAKALPHNNFREKYTELTGYAVVRTSVRNLFNTIPLMKCILIVQLISFDTLREGYEKSYRSSVLIRTPDYPTRQLAPNCLYVLLPLICPKLC